MLCIGLSECNASTIETGKKHMHDGEDLWSTGQSICKVFKEPPNLFKVSLMTPGF